MSKEQAAAEEYRNKSVNNQRGGSIEVNNTTDKDNVIRPCMRKRKIQKS